MTTGTVHVESAAERFYTLAQAGQAIAGGLACTADTIVEDLEAKGVGRRGEPYA